MKKTTPKSDYKFLRLMGLRYIRKCKLENSEITAKTIKTFLTNFHSKYLTQKVDIEDCRGAIWYAIDCDLKYLEYVINQHEEKEHLYLPKIAKHDYRRIIDRNIWQQMLYLSTRDLGYSILEENPKMGIIDLDSILYNSIVDNNRKLAEYPFRYFVENIVRMATNRVFRKE